jgi:hypothetical protein
MKNPKLTYQIITKQIIVLLILFSCFSLSTSIAQTKKVLKMKKPAGNYEILTGKGDTKFPFELNRNQIVIPVKMNANPLKLVLDSGMPADGVLLFGSHHIDDLKLQYVGKASVMGVGGKTVEADLAMDKTVNLPGMELRNQMVIVMPHDSIRNIYFEGKHGIIGFSLFSRFVLKIDYDSMKITLVEPEKFQYAGSGQEFKVAVINNRIFLPVGLKTNKEVSILANLVVDTGNSATLTLNVESSKDIAVPEKSITYTTRSINDEIFRYAGRIPGVQLGGITFDNVLCSFRTQENEPRTPWEKEGNLGQGLLRRFNLLFDIPNKRIIFEPNQHLDEPFEFNMAGFQFIRTKDGHFRITHIIPNSPASQSELEEGDQIININGKPSNQYTYDDLDDILSLEGTLVKLVIFHRGKEKEVHIELRQLI